MHGSPYYHSKVGLWVLSCGVFLFLRYETHASDESEEFLVECEDLCKPKSSRDTQPHFHMKIIERLVYPMILFVLFS